MGFAREMHPSTVKERQRGRVGEFEVAAELPMLGARIAAVTTSELLIAGDGDEPLRSTHTHHGSPTIDSPTMAVSPSSCERKQLSEHCRQKLCDVRIPREGGRVWSTEV